MNLYPDAVLVVDGGGVIAEANSKATELFGYSNEELVGMHAGQLVAGGASTATIAEALTAQRGRFSRTTSGSELLGCRKDGREFPSEVSTSKLEFDSRTYTVASVRDITPLRKAQAQQEEAERLFALGIDHSPIGIVLTDTDARLTRVNPAAMALLGRPPSELLGHRLTDFIHPPTADESTLFEQAVRDGNVHLCNERRYLRPNGEILYVEQVVVLLRDSDGEPDSFYVHLQDVTGRKKAEQDLEHLAMHDPLTGLANRRLLGEHLDGFLARAKRAGEQVVVIFIDLDQFKIINDARGHTVGDAMLVELSRRLGDLTRQSDVLARFGGDEFVIVCEDMDDEAAQRLVTRIASAVDEPFLIDGEEIFSKVSVGIAFSEPGDTAESLLRKSDTAMYEVKDSGRREAAIFHDSMQQKASQRMATESQLRGALRRDELCLRFQPIINLKTDRPAGFEALVRWEHPERGLLSPAEFLPVAHDSGLIVDIDKWVLERAVRQLRDWESNHPTLRSPTVAVNLSTRHLNDRSFITHTQELLAVTGIEPHQLHFEITEVEEISDVDLAIEHMNEAAELGVCFGIDDFGSGHSSLHYLHRLPVQTLKLDKSFVQGLGNHDPRPGLIVGAVIDLAHALGIEVVGEGVETKPQLEELQRLGCDMAQGFLWSKPMDPSEGPKWLETNCAG
ncbi:bifunctional diguanylate cyclase/phosphodiesterase [Nesterenkonia sp. NBAIMH1]|uniref:sensor domain-containing protein n=1 Tax=Nesterenkonia sp. NBAIMH1 TaxID=2600320 RepID=UPI00143D1095|nr:bifunctional diguanylate cyclase/phosphodiesterase [Nesterenkonia sp. NBAIMH1]